VLASIFISPAGQYPLAIPAKLTMLQITKSFCFFFQKEALLPVVFFSYKVCAA
jgi:hypothetical protein